MKTSADENRTSGDGGGSALAIRTTSDTSELSHVRRQIESFCTSAGFDERAVGEIGLCVNEAMANVIRHAYRGRPGEPIEVAASVVSGTLHVSIRDWGCGIQPGPLPQHKIDPMNPGGLGLICLGRLMDKITFTKQPSGMLLEMSRKRADASLTPHGSHGKEQS